MNTLTILLAPALLAVGMLLLTEIGWRLGRRHAQRDNAGHESLREACKIVDSAVFALLGLLVAFTFGAAASRFNDRRYLIIEEVNAIGNALNDVDLLPGEVRQASRAALRRYLEARLAVYGALPDVDAARAAVAVADKEAEGLWRSACGSFRDRDPPMPLVNDLNNLISVGTRRTLMMEIHLPTPIAVLLFVMALGSALLVGIEMARAPTRSLLQMLAFALSIAITVWVIIDVEYPRQGLIRIDEHDHAMQEMLDRLR